MRFFTRAACCIALLAAAINAQAGTCPANTKYVTGDNATFVTQSAPNTMEAGKSYGVSVTFCNSGSTTWTYKAPPTNGNYANYIRLGTQNTQDNTRWGLYRVDLSPGDNITPGTTKTFTFNVTAPTQSQANFTYDFQFGMLREGVAWFGMGADEPITSFLTPVITLVNKAGAAPVVPTVAPVVVNGSGPAAFSYANFAGANVFGLQYLYAMMTINGVQYHTHTQWIPSSSQMMTVATRAKAMNLKVLRVPLIIPPDAGDAAEYNPYDWAWGGVVTTGTAAAINNVNVTNTINLAEGVLSAAASQNLKVIFTLDGYTEFDVACNANGLWKKSFNAVKTNAATIINKLSSNTALYAWDLLNEPLWNADQYGCLDVAPSTYATDTDGVAIQPLSGSANVQSITEVVYAVHAMYNLVRANDAGNHPTTVGEGTSAYVHYWNDISSFASPHLYVVPQDLINAQVAANATGAKQPGVPPPFTQFSGSPSANNAWTMSDQVLQTQIPAIAAATINAMKNEAITTDSVPLPLVIGEYGVYMISAAGGPKAITVADAATYYGLFLPTLSSGQQLVYTSVNIGGIFWDLQTIPAPANTANFSLLNSGLQLLTPACTLANSLGAYPTCYPN